MKQKPDLLVLVKNHDTLLIDESALVEGVFWKIYNDTLKGILQKTQKKIGVPEDVLERINEQRQSDAHYQKAYKRYLSIQRDIISVPDELTKIIKSKKSLLFTRNKALAQIATRSKKAPFFFSLSPKSALSFLMPKLKRTSASPSTTNLIFLRASCN
ncbi:hypothetical protein [Helicobacter felis]|uniref:hypothetical protein n=1 Tax=Helicobacter felis TaxID=214 RepID=UPI001F400305|nr:hypothetical protein [Helicobacter felis]